MFENQQKVSLKQVKYSCILTKWAKLGATLNCYNRLKSKSIIMRGCAIFTMKKYRRYICLFTNTHHACNFGK